MPTPTDITIEESFSVADAVDVAPPGSTFEAYIETGVTQLGEGDQVHEVVFNTQKAALSYIFDELVIFNEVDASPIVLGYIETAKTVDGFQLTTSAVPDTGNYYARWKVRIPTTVVEGAVVATPSTGAVTEVTAVGQDGIHTVVANADTAPTITVSLTTGGIALSKLAQSVLVDDGTVATKTGAQTLTNKSMDGANNTFTNLPLTSLTGDGIIAQGLTDPNGDRLPGWDNDVNQFAFFSTGAGLAITGTTPNKSIQASGITDSSIASNAAIQWSKIRNYQYAIRDISAAVTNEVDTMLSGETAGAGSQNIFSTRDNITPAYARNTGLFCSTVDLTGLAVFRDDSVGGAGALVSPRHIIFANHAGMANGTVIRFVTSGNVIVSRTLTSSQQVGSTDIQVGKLSADVPSTISFYRVLDTTESEVRLIGSPVILLDQTQKAFIADISTITTSVVLAQSGDTTRSTFWKGGGMVSGDSGHPFGVVIDGEFVLLSSFHNAVPDGPSLAQNITGINAAMTALGGGYQLSVYGLSNLHKLFDGDGVVTVDGTTQELFRPLAGDPMLRWSGTRTEAGSMDIGPLGLSQGRVRISAGYINIANNYDSASLFLVDGADPDEHATPRIQFNGGNVKIDDNGTITSKGSLKFGDVSLIWENNGDDLPRLTITDGFGVTFDIGANLTANRTVTFANSSGTLAFIDVAQTITATQTLNNGVNIALGTSTGSKIGTAGGASGQKLGFLGATPIVQPLLATGAGASVDNVITVLQNLGLVRQS